MSKRQDNSDFMSRKQDERLEQLEEKLTALYANAENEIRAEFTDFTEKFAREDQEKQAMVEAGEINEEEYLAWRKTQILKSNDYSKAVESMTNMLVNTDIAAMATINGELPAVVAESYDFVQALGFKAAEEGGITAGTFQVYNAETVQILVRDNPDLLPKPSQSTIEQLGGTVDIPEDKKWAKDRINREITQGIVQGQSLPKIAERLQRVTTMDRNAAKRNARTAMTGAENMGRAASAADLKENGIPVQEVWSAAGDDRVRETHRLLDGTYKSEAGYFGEGILTTPLRYAGDPLGDPEEVYNCRCRTGIVLPGIDHSQDDKLYEEFMKQFEESKDEQEAPEPQVESQHREPEQKIAEEIKAPEMVERPATTEDRVQIALDNLPKSMAEDPDVQTYIRAGFNKDYEAAENVALTDEEFDKIDKAMEKGWETETIREGITTPEPAIQWPDFANEESESEVTIHPDADYYHMKNPEDSYANTEEFEKSTKEWTEAITKEEMKEVYEYSDDTFGAINAYLRGEFEGVKVDEEQVRRSLGTETTLEERIQRLDSAIDKFNLEGDLQVYRVVDFSNDPIMQNEFNKLKAGDIIQDNGYGSTCTSKQLEWEGRTRMEIDVPAGQGRGAYIDWIAKEAGQKEFLLARDGMFEFVDKRKEGDETIYHFKLKPKK